MSNLIVTLRVAKQSEYAELKEYLQGEQLSTALPMFQSISAEIAFNLSEALYPRTVYVADGLNKTEFILIADINSADFETSKKECVSTVALGQTIQVYWQVDSLSKAKVRQYLLSIPKFDWNHGFRLVSQNIKMANIIDELIKMKHLATLNLQVIVDTSCHIYSIPDEQKITEHKLPEGYRYGRLTPHHVPLLFRNWHYSCEENMDEFKKFTELIPSCAIFRENDDDTKNPVSYVFLYNIGMLGLTFTDPEHRRKGLASAATIKLCLNVRKEYNMMAIMPTEFTNKTSQVMHEKLGFKYETDVIWRIYAPYHVS